MRFWVVTVGEPLPTDSADNRLHRGGMIAQTLRKRGHEVLWWTSTMDHVLKDHRARQSKTVTTEDGIIIHLLHGVRYVRNVSLRRLINHVQIAKQFYREGKQFPRPDVIISSFPTIELSERSAALGREWGIPVVIDIRDLWPDIFTLYVPKPLKPLAYFALKPFIRNTHEALRNCSSVIGVSEEYLNFGLRYADRPRGPLDHVFPLGYTRGLASRSETEQAGEKLRLAGVDPNRNICWFVGAFGVTYEVDVIIEAARQMAAARPDVQFVISGDGEMRRAWAAKAAGLTNVVFTGWVNTAALNYMAGVAEIGIAAYKPNAPQSLPNKIFEYLSAGVPVVSSLLGECAALLKRYECGVTYEAGSPASLVSELARYLDNEALRETASRNGQRLFEEQFRADMVYSRMAYFFESLAGRLDRVEQPAPPAKRAGGVSQR